jgi:hypothetical protein
MQANETGEMEAAFEANAVGWGASPVRALWVVFPAVTVTARIDT